jgi:CDP-diacylglycerol--serine O-phosphatidyltransferase
VVNPVKRAVSRRLRRSDVRRAAPALPNGFTLGNLFFGIFAIVSASHGEFARAVLFIVLGGVCDGFDGRIARATGTGSRFGVELDSLVDAISFGFAPAMIIYYSVLDREGGAWWLLVFLFTACAVIRLARFNVMQGGTPKRHFQGLPSPAAGGTLATYYWFSQTSFYNQTRIADLPWPDMVKVLMGGLAILMITNVPYPAFPKVGVRTWSGLAGLVVVVGSIVGIFKYGREFFFPAGMAYVLYGLTRAVALGLVDRIPTGAALDDDRADDDDRPSTRRGRDVVVGRRRRHGGRWVRLVPSPDPDTRPAGSTGDGEEPRDG